MSRMTRPDELPPTPTAPVLTTALSLPIMLALVVGACAGNVYLPGEPGGAAADVSGLADRELWLAAHPDLPDDVHEAILNGVFIEGMTIEHRDVVTNSDRRGTTGYGYWRSREVPGQVRYQWYVAGVREPFDDGRGRAVCELVYEDERLSEVHYCGAGDRVGEVLLRRERTPTSRPVSGPTIPRPARTN